MDYTDLKTNVQDICEQTFTDSQLDLFTQQVEQRIYNTVQFPDIRKTDTLATVAATATVTLPSDFLYMFSLAVVDGDDDYTYLVNKDQNFIREAYPAVATTGLPAYYAINEAYEITLGPTPDDAYDLVVSYGYYPESIVTAGTTWLGDNFDSALLNGVLLEAARFMKEEPDIIQNYEKMYLQSIALLKQLGDGKLRRDAYRSGQYREAVQ
ncbi:MAG TPA: hypothetical protein VKP88_04205 [Candidatus Paceibacterota bacterium]|nr:hypothetical protein [Candidatus Paceibacterota bacterium]